MNKERIIRFLEEQLRFAKEQVAQLLEQVQAQSIQLATQSEQIGGMTVLIEKLTESVDSLEKALITKGASLEKAHNSNRALGKLIGKKSEKITPVTCPDEAGAQKTPKEPSSAKERGNNNAKRKEHFELEVQEHDLYPPLSDFQPEMARLLKTVDSIRYEYIPPRFIKHINHLHYYLHQGSIIYAESVAAPLLNSNYDASFIAGILQLRYIYSMPVERIVKFFAESGFELKKSTAHGLVKKAAQMFDIFEEVLREAILKDTYIHMDEVHYTVLEPGPKSITGRASSKVYIWAALAHHLKLVHFFYQDGSRARKVLTRYIKPDYQGAIQSDGLEDYKILETQEYPNVIRLACFQHCKRKFIDIGPNNKDAQQIIQIINQLYQLEHRRPPDLSKEQELEYRQKQALPILNKLKEKLLKIKNRKSTLPKSNISKAVNYTLNEFQALSNYTLNPDYELDNNAIERINRYISLSRRNSLFCGSHQGVKRAALIYSLACSCRINGINTFEYFKDLLNKFVMVNTNTDKRYLRNLLPDKWNKE